MLASACPGWVCYAEKTQAGNLLPHISTTKSPQAIMGTIVKRRLAALRGWEAGNVYHAAVMPCYDKKLEASRDDFMLPGAWVGGLGGEAWEGLKGRVIAPSPSGLGLHDLGMGINACMCDLGTSQCPLVLNLFQRLGTLAVWHVLTP